MVDAREGCRADADRHHGARAEIGARQVERGNARADAPADLDGVLVAGIGKDDRELVATVARGEIARPARRLADDRSRLPEALVPGLVAIGIVELLEVIDIEHQQRQRRARADGAVPLAAQRGVEGAPVGQPGQAVAVGERGEFAFQRLLAGDVADGEHDVARPPGVGVEDRPGIGLDPQRLAIDSHDAEFHAVFGNLALKLLLQRFGDALAVVRMQERIVLGAATHAQELLRRRTEHALGRGRQVAHPPFRIEPAHHVDAMVGQEPVELVVRIPLVCRTAHAQATRQARH